MVTLKATGSLTPGALSCKVETGRALAEAGRYDDALATANQALQLAKASNRTNLLPRIERAITLYQSHTPWRETPTAN